MAPVGFKFCDSNVSPTLPITFADVSNKKQNTNQLNECSFKIIKNLTNLITDTSSFLSLFRSTMTSLLGTALLALALSGPTLAFLHIRSESSHTSITGSALLQKVTDTCRAVAKADGHEFKPTVGWTMTIHTHTYILYIFSELLIQHLLYKCSTNDINKFNKQLENHFVNLCWAFQFSTHVQHNIYKFSQWCMFQGQQNKKRTSCMRWGARQSL